VTFPLALLIFGLAICVGLPLFMYGTSAYSRQFDPERTRKIRPYLLIVYVLLGFPFVVWAIALWASGVTRASEVFG